MSGNTVLIVDDERLIRRSLSFVLGREGFEVLEAHDGEQAIEALHEHHPDLVFLDVMMPKKNGYEVLEEIQASPDLSCRVIMLTAKGQVTDRDRALSLGVDDYMTKPFSPNAIVERAREILDKSQA
jgi:DNA-binding response OmpR family regulator